MKVLAAAAVAAGLAFAGASNAAVLFSEDFSGYDTLNIPHDAHTATNGTNSITSDYFYRVPNGENHFGQPNSMYDEGTWTIATNPIATHDLWIDLAGNENPFLILNGATTSPPATAYESQALAIGPGTYSYSYDIINVCCNFHHDPGVSSVLQLWYFKGLTADTLDPTPIL